MTYDRSVRLQLDEGVELDADLWRPEGARATVVFAHGSGSSRHSPRNRAVAARLGSAGLESVLLDLLTPAEDERDRVTRQHRFDIPLLSGRVAQAVDWAVGRPAGLPVGLFGASTGAAAALVAAAGRPAEVGAVVSRGGRPDLAGDALPAVAAPTLLIVGGRDLTVLDLNEGAAGRMTAEVEIKVVPGATHLFEEPGALEQVADLAAEWFTRHLGGEA